MVRPDFLRAVHREDDLVREPVRPEVHRRRNEEHEDEAVAAAKGFAKEQQYAAHQTQQECGLESVRHDQYVTCTAGLKACTTTHTSAGLKACTTTHTSAGLKACTTTNVRSTDRRYEPCDQCRALRK